MTSNSKEYAHAYYLAHKEQFKVYARKSYLKKRGITEPKTPKVELTRSQIYYAANKERIKEQQKAYRKRVKEKTYKQAYNKAYYMANKDKINAMQRKTYAKKRRAERLSRTALWRFWLKIFW